MTTLFLFRVGLPTLSPGPAQVSGRFRHPIDISRKAHLIARYRALPADHQREIQEADQLRAHRFRLLGHAMNHGPSIAWSQDPVTRADWSRDFSPRIPYRGPKRLGDIKLPWELSKHQYFFTLGKAAWLTGDFGYAREIVNQIDHWISDNPCHRGIHWISALESGMRVMSWILTYPFYVENCEDTFRKRLCHSIAQHLLFVERNLSTGTFANTHLVGEAAALALGGLFLDCRHSPRWVAKGLRHLNEQIELQVRTDGFHVEQSIAYHRFFLDLYYLVDAVLGANGLSLPTRTRETMELMTAALMDLLFPDGTSPNVGDCDDARGIWCRADCPQDYRSLLALGAMRFARGDFKSLAGGTPEELLWLYGERGLDSYEALPCAPPNHTSAGYTDCGYFVMRSGWATTDSMMIFDCGPLGHGPAGHGHADALSVALYVHGHTFLVDSGTYSYNLDYRWRDAFRSTRAHNTVTVDGLDQSAMQDRMSWSTFARAKALRFVTSALLDFVDGQHDGYQRLADPVNHRRVVFFLKPDAWLIWDELDSQFNHDIEWRWHFPPGFNIESNPTGNGFICNSPQGDRLQAWILAQGQCVTPRSNGGASAASESWHSPQYGIRLAAPAVSIQQNSKSRCSLFTSFSSSDTIAPLTSEGRGDFSITLSEKSGQIRTVYYRYESGCPAPKCIDEAIFDGVLLYRRRCPSNVGSVLATDFRVLSIPGLIEVESATAVESLILDQSSCQLTLVSGDAGQVTMKARDGIGLYINGQQYY